MTRWPGNPDVKGDPLTRWPNDPVPCLLRFSKKFRYRHRAPWSASAIVTVKCRKWPNISWHHEIWRSRQLSTTAVAWWEIRKKIKVVEFTVRSWEDTLNLGLAYTVEPMQQTGPKISDVLGPHSCLHFVAVKFHFITQLEISTKMMPTSLGLSSLLTAHWIEWNKNRKGMEWRISHFGRPYSKSSLVSYRVAHTKFFFKSANR